MKKNMKALDVDFIGDQNSPVTKDEEALISKAIQELKQKRKRKSDKRKVVKKKQPA